MGATEQLPAPRIPLKMDVEFRRSYARDGVTGQLRNISLSGAFLEHANTALTAGDKLSITFMVSGRVRKIHAAVVWSNTLGVGVKFIPSNNRDVQIVDDLMYFVENNREDRRTVMDSIFKQVS